MKAVRLFCPCGAVKLFSGATTDAVIAAIDAAGWVDRPTKNRVKGECDGVCPTCEAIRNASPIELDDSLREVKPMTIYTARIRFKSTGQEREIREDSMLVLQLRLIALAGYIDILEEKQVEADESVTVH